MSIKDIFEYTDRWDSVGLDCSNCVYEQPPDKWPDISKNYRCQFHKMSLIVELNENGFKEGEWFCKHFQDKGTANKKALDKFTEVKELLDENILYGFYGENGNLKETPFQRE